LGCVRGSCVSNRGQGRCRRSGYVVEEEQGDRIERGYGWVRWPGTMGVVAARVTVMGATSMGRAVNGRATPGAGHSDGPSPPPTQ